MGESTDREKQSRLHRIQRERSELQDMDLRAVLKTPSGRRFIWRLIDGTAGIHEVYMGKEDAEAHFINGKRHVGQVLMREAQRVSSSDYVQLIREALQEQHEDGQLRAAVKSEPETEDEH